jgi:hypothetical protein
MKPTKTERAGAGAIRNGSLTKSLNYLMSNQRDFVFDTAIKVLQKQIYPRRDTGISLEVLLIFGSVKKSIYQTVCKEYRHSIKGKSNFARSNFSGNRGRMEAL